MLQKIISGGQTGADRAALDVAIEFDVPHGGWIPKGRKTEDGTLPDKYHLNEMPTTSYPKRTEQNVIDSDATLILSHGKLTGGSALTLKMAKKHDRQWLHLNFNKTNAFDAAHLINSWIVRHGIRVLNVAGARANKDPNIYDAKFRVLETALHLGFIETNLKKPLQPELLPKTVDEAVARLMSELTMKDKTKIAKMNEEDLSALPLTMGQYIREQFGLTDGNEELMESCCSLSREDDIHEETASMVIIEALWQKLRQTHALRVLKQLPFAPFMFGSGVYRRLSTETTLCP